MQELGLESTALVSAGMLLQGSAPCHKRNGHAAPGPAVASPLWTNGSAIRERAQQTWDQSIMLLVHELRAPAAASKSMVATLRYLNPQDAQLGSFLVRIENRMDQLLVLVDDILSLSHARAGYPLGQPVIVDLVAQTGSICRSYQEDAAVKGLAMSVELPVSPLRVRMAVRACQLLISNLVSNAVKYTLTGSVRVILRKDGPWAVLSVRDTGIGIPPEERNQLFTEFFRASNARDSQVPGTGLGLAAAKALVEGCDGELELESQVDRGSQFTARLPLCRTEASRHARSCLRAEGNAK